MTPLDVAGLNVYAEQLGPVWQPAAAAAPLPALGQRTPPRHLVAALRDRAA